MRGVGRRLTKEGGPELLSELLVESAMWVGEICVHIEGGDCWAPICYRKVQMLNRATLASLPYDSWVLVSYALYGLLYSFQALSR